MFFEEGAELLVGQHIGDGCADAIGVLCVTAAEFGVDGLADVLQAVWGHEVLEDGVAVLAVFAEVVCDGVVHGLSSSLRLIQRLTAGLGFFIELILADQEKTQDKLV